MPVIVRRPIVDVQLEVSEQEGHSHGRVEVIAIATPCDRISIDLQANTIRVHTDGVWQGCGRSESPICDRYTEGTPRVGTWARGTAGGPNGD